MRNAIMEKHASTAVKCGCKSDRRVFRFVVALVIVAELRSTTPKSLHNGGGRGEKNEPKKNESRKFSSLSHRNSEKRKNAHAPAQGRRV